MGRQDTPQLDARTRAWCLAAAAACVAPLLLQLRPALALAIAIAGIAGTALSWRRPLPTVARLLLALLLLAVVLAAMRFSFGRDTGCALLAAMLAVKPTETFGVRDARSLVGFALFAPFATFLLDQGPVSLALGIFAAVLALAALQRLAELASGVLVGPGARRRLVGVVRMAVLGLPFALAAFWLFPRLATPLWGVPERALARPGLSDEMSPGQWLDLMTDDSPALRARFFGAVPAMDQMYWRGPVLWHFDGRTWSQAGWMGSIPPADVRPGAPTWDYEIALEPTDRRQLVALDLPLAAPPGARLALDHGLHVRQPLSTLTRWRLRSAPPIAYEPELKVTLRQVALRLPEGFNPRTHALAREWRLEAGDNDAAIVRRALAWIRSDFGYTLQTPLPGRHAVDEFLFDTQAGYCEHFSSSFVVLMRAAGIPARVVTGYVGGYRNPIGDYWLVRRSDAHAWAEVWLDGPGWTRVDPTAAVAPEHIYDTLADRAPGAGFGELAPAVDMADWMRRGWNDFVLGFDAERQREMFQPLGLEARPWQLAALFAAIAGLALALTAWLVARRERERDIVLRGWRLVGRRYARIGLGRTQDEPALAWANRVASARPDGAPGLVALSRRFALWRYARRQGDASVAHALASDLRAHRP
ncbi:MAG TPA: DUF3488 and transglutaminase-like domain-containing protein [Xanthomonadaceae bacterium]|nr:DUF3488 and transglutaminase-like domain-containing protein [Xanthomonadaceae bacterium]